METNESILTREIVAIDDRKRLGKMKELCVDCDTLSVCYYIVNSAATNAALVLPFDKSLAVGDTFITIQSRDDFLLPSDDEAKRVISEGFRLVGVDVFSQNGNRLGSIENYEFDPTSGKVTKIILGRRVAFTADTFVFFAPDFVFVDDGEATAFDVRHGVKTPRGRKKPAPRVVTTRSPRAATAAAKAAPAARQAAAAPAAPAKAPVVEAPRQVPVEVPAKAPAPAPAPVPAATAADAGGEDDVLKEFLLDAVVSDDVESKDGLFKIAKGTKLTKALIDEAQKHDALLLLTMSVE